jgi:hypothetical protein
LIIQGGKESLPQRNNEIMKKIIFPALFFLIVSCSGAKIDDYEAQKSNKSSSASSRINNIQSGSNTILKDLDE